MKKLVRRALVFALSVTMTVTSCVVPAYAEEYVSPGKQQMSDVSMETADIKGENSFGRMLMDLMSEEESEQEARERFVTDLSVEGKTAKAEFFTNRDAELVVGIYTDDSESDMQLIASGKTDIYPEMDEAEVEIDIDEMPEYFVSVAYMLDPDTHEPISEQHVNRMNTRELREVMDKTMNDYDQEDVLDLDTNDDNIKTNYAVINEDTKRFETSGDSNKVTATDEQNLTYVIENADPELKELQQGDTFILDQGSDNILIGIVRSISVDGDTVTVVTEPDAEFEDVFDIVKIDETAKAEDCTFEPSEEAKELGLDIKTGATGDEGLDLDRVDVDVAGNFELKAEGKFCELKADDNNYVKLTGSMAFAFQPSVKLVLCLKYQYLKFDFPVGFTAELKFEAKGAAAKKRQLNLGKAGAFFGPVKLSVDVEPQFSVTASGTLSYKAKIFCGAVIDSQAKPKLKPYVGAKSEGIELSADLEIFLGMSIAPTASIVDQSVAKTDIKAVVGFLVSASNSTKLTYDDSPVVHLCGNGNCIDGSVDFTASFSYEAELLKWLTYTKELKAFKIHITDFYLSLKYDEFGFGECPHQLNEVTVTVVDSDEENITGAAISAKNTSSGKTAKTYSVNGSAVTEITPKTDKKGKATFYLPYGQFKLTAGKKGYLSGTKKVKLHGEEKNVEITLEEDPNGSDPDDPGPDDPDDPIGPDSGYCGRFLTTVPKDPDDGNGEKNIKWTLSEDGTLTLEGSGDMREYSVSYYPENSDEPIELIDAPWTGRVKNIVFKGDINGIGSYAFNNCDDLTSVTLPETLSEEEDHVGSEEIYYDHEGIQSDAFSGCDNLETVIIPKDTKISWIHWGTFANCEKLSTVQLPDSIKYIDDRAFEYCTSLESIKLPGDLIEIGESAFSDTGLTSIALPDNLKVIWSYAFASTEISNVVIPASVIRIGGSAFAFCNDLDEIYFKGDAPKLCTYTDSLVPSIGSLDSEDPWYVHETSGTPLPDNTVTAYIPSGNSTWTDEMKGLYEGKDPSDPNQDPDEPTDLKVIWETWVPSKSASADTMSSNGLSLMSWYSGDYEYDGDVLVSEFSDLVPGEEYVLAALKDPDAEDLFASDNLMYVWQDKADENGSLSFRYLLGEETDVDPAIVLYGAGGESIDEVDVDLMESEYVYSGARIYPNILLRSYGYHLEEGEDYELTGDTSAVNPGTYSVTVTCKGDYYGSKTLEYKVVKGDPYLFGYDKKLTAGQTASLQIENESDAQQTVVSSDPSVATVTDSGKVVARKPGTAWMTISVPETDHYQAAEYRAKITVVPKPVKLVSAKNVRGRKVKAVWKKGSMITGYELQYSLKKSFRGGKIKVIKKAKTTKLTVKKLLKSNTYYFRIRTYKKIGKKMYRSKWSNVKKVKIKK